MTFWPPAISSVGNLQLPIPPPTVEINLPRLCCWQLAYKESTGGAGELMTSPSKPSVTNSRLVPCFPLHALLVALNQSTVDYLSLDVEGYELEVSAWPTANSFHHGGLECAVPVLKLAYFITAIDRVFCVGRACDKQTREVFQSSCLTGVRLWALITL